MKISALIIALALVISTGILGLVAYKQFIQWHQLATQKARDAAVDGCMQNARYTWQAINPQNPDLPNITQEPDRYWYQLCMQEKGYDIVIDL